MHGELSSAVAEALRRHGHEAQTLAGAGLAIIDPSQLLAEAQRRQLDIITSDRQLASATLKQSVGFGRSIVVLQVQPADVEQDDAIERLFERYKRLSPGRMYTVTASRVKVRQLPGTS